MKNTLFLTMLAAALLGSGVANAETLYASQYAGGYFDLGTDCTYDKLVVDTPLTLTGDFCPLDLYDGATIEFQKQQGIEAICCICPPADEQYASVYFNVPGDTYNFMFNEGAQAIVAASAGKAIPLIEVLNEESLGFAAIPPQTTLKLNGVGYNETVELNGTSFKYVGPKPDDYVFMQGEIGFTGFAEGSHALNLVVGGSVPEPATGSLSLLALAGLCARRRKK